MRREQLTEKILDIKREKGWTWKHICEEIGARSPALVVDALLGQMKLPRSLAHSAAQLFGRDTAEERMLSEVPTRGNPIPPTDPLIYRFYELVLINGPAWKALIEEEFGDGILSAVDFDMAIERMPHERGDRAKFSMSGKFLPFKYYGNGFCNGPLIIKSLRIISRRQDHASVRGRREGRHTMPSDPQAGRSI